MNKINRVVIISALVVLAATFYEVKLKPQSRPMYERALLLYRQENFSASLLELERAYQIEPNSTAILVLRGWNYLKMRQYNDAKENFGRAARLNPELVEAQLGLAYVALETGQGEAPLAGVKAMMEADPNNQDFQLANAVALRQTGHNLEAQAIFQRLSGRGRYGDLAKRHLEEMYGLSGTGEAIPSGLPPYTRPAELRMDFRVNGTQLQRRNGSDWQPFYVKGVSISPGVPGSFSTEAPNQADIYATWLKEISQLGANTVRVYSVLPPSFYRALKKHNESSSNPLFLLQQVWLEAPESRNLFAAGVEKDAQSQIAKIVDLLHGQGDVPGRKGTGGGIYTTDVSPWVAGLLIGREWEPNIVLANNELNSFRKNYKGKYFSLETGSPTEVWLAGLLDYTAGYEVDKYNHQRPLAVVNWPSLDPLSHPTEAGLLDEIKFRKRMGEHVGSALPKVIDDDDSVSIDETRFRAEAGFKAGIFAAYTVFPFAPEFLLTEPALLQARDHVGPNSYFGYLQKLKAHYSAMPLVVVDYGVSTSVAVAHYHPYGWNEGGLSEREQGDLLARMTRNIADAGCAGGVVQGWQDEWSRSHWLTARFEVPDARRALWFDATSPRETQGLWTWDPSAARLFSNDTGAWSGVKPLYESSRRTPAYPLSDGSDPQRTLKAMSVASDEAFVYVRLAVESLPRGADGAPKLDQANYLIGISTNPGKAGGRVLPVVNPQVRISEGANFLIHVAGNTARLVVASNYNPYGVFPVEGVPSRTHVGLKPKQFTPSIEDWTPFDDIQVETNRMRFSRDGTAFQPRVDNRSVLRYGVLDANLKTDTVATWTADFGSNALLFRIPWSMLYVTDPSSRQVYAGHGEEGVRPAGTDGLAMFAVSFRPSGPADLKRFPAGNTPVSDALPQLDRNGNLNAVRVYNWPTWDKVKVNGRLKASAKVLEKTFREVKPKV